MQTVTINIEDKALDKVMYVLKNLSDIEIVKSMNNDKVKNSNAYLKQFEQIVNIKSKKSVLVNDDTILNPHAKLSNDIS